MADWSSVFEETGDEDGDWERSESDESRTSILQYLQNYNPVVAYFFTVNYVLGVGCLGIPYAFQQSGLVLATLVVITVSVISYMTVMFVAEASYKGMLSKRARNSVNPFLPSPSKALLSRATGKVVDYLSTESTNRQRFDSCDSIGDGDDHEAKGEMEVTSLAQEFYGHRGKVSYQVCLTLLTYVGLLAYAQVFNASFRAQVWPSSPSLLPVLLFGLIVIPLSCVDLVEQISVQVAMSVFRFLSLGILLFGTMMALLMMPDTLHTETVSTISPLAHLHHPTMSPTTIDSMRHTPLVRFSGFALMFTTAIFSQLFQHSVPGLIRPLKEEDKKSMSFVFKAALSTTALLYISIGVCCSLYFGIATQQSINLNFIGFSWGVPESSKWYPTIKTAAFIVVVFPALDTLSVFPLIANTLGNSLHAAVPKSKKFLRQWKICGSDKKSLGRTARLLWRLVASVPPVLMSSLVTDLSLSLQLAGVCGIMVALVAPSLLQKATMDDLVPANSPSLRTLLNATPFSSRFSEPFYSSMVLVVAAAALVICLLQMLGIL